MIYESERGKWDSLQHMRADYLTDKDAPKFRILPPHETETPWPQDLLHASDVGGCPKAAMYRLLGTPKKPRSASSKANRAVMFWAAYQFHYLSYSALNWAGLLVRYEVSVPLPDGWAGAFDAEILQSPDSDPFMFDEKTVLPNALNYGYDKPKRPNILQVTVYGDAVKNYRGLIEYTDRAGSNTPKECPVDLNAYVAEKDALMAELEGWRDNLPELPPELEQEYVGHYTRDGQDMVLKTVGLATPWSCGYCSYHLCKNEQRMNPASGRMKKYGWTQPSSTCKPKNVPEIVVAEFGLLGELKSCKDEHLSGVEKFLADHLPRIPDPLEETE